ncbi:MAG: glycosyltransferase [Desulfosalsimonas sp.]
MHTAGFVSTRFGGTDGVTLETGKWVEVFEKYNFTCCYFAGEIDQPAQCSYLAPEAHFRNPEIKQIHESLYGITSRGREITQRIQSLKRRLKDHLYAFIERFGVDLLVVENALAIPLNIPLGLAITELLCETDMPAIAHHHDFYWERQRFSKNAVSDYLRMAFPSCPPNMEHVAISTTACDQLSLRTGISATLIPNVMKFENPPQGPDGYAADLRSSLGINDYEFLILQPTRVIKRKGIEHAIELVRRLEMPARLVISHASGDEGYQYEQRIREYSELMGVDTMFISDIIDHRRGTTQEGSKIYTLEDVYPHADLVTYPSSFEGFGNAFLEAVYYKKPVVINTYSSYAADIKPKGFDVVELNGYVTKEAVDQARKILTDPDYCRQMVDNNYEVASRHFSYSVLEQELRPLVRKATGCPMIAGSREKNIA